MKKLNYIFIGILIFIPVILFQIPFLNSDPDIEISTSRDANTDEGLYSSQIRNYINHNNLTFKHNSCFVITPVFGAFLYIPFKLFGTKLVVGRLSILLLSLIISVIIFQYNKFYGLFGFLFFIINYFEYYVFHYFHFCLAEILSTSFMFLSIFFTVEAIESRKPMRFSILSAVAISISYFLKIQFIYILALLPLTIVLFMFVKGIDKKLLFKQLRYTIATIVILLGLYLIIWYLPNKSFFNYVMKSSTTGKFVDFSNLLTHLDFIFKHIFLNRYLKVFTYSFFILLASGIFFFFKTKSRRYKFLFLAFVVWFLLETHKLTLTYLPSRYLISLFFSMNLIIILVLCQLIEIKAEKRYAYIIKGFAVIFILVLGTKNLTDYVKSLNRRTHVIADIDNYLSQYKFEDNPIIGAWAPSLTWKSEAISFPVWKGYFNDKNVIENYKPAIIITETDEEDSNQAYSSRGINIDNYADSIKYYKINNWEIKLLWVHQKAVNSNVIDNP